MVVAAAPQPNTPPLDFLNALRTADTFAYAWAHRDAALGLTTLTPALRAKADDARAFFIGTSSPSHYAFEVGGGKLMKPKTYWFGITLYVTMTGGGLEQSRQPIPLVLTQAADGKWYVAALPVLPG